MKQVSQRRSDLGGKPHIYLIRTFPKGPPLWTYTPVVSHMPDPRNLAAHNFCRRLMGRK